MARPQDPRENAPDPNWVDAHRRALEQISVPSVSQAGRYAPRAVPAGAGVNNFDLPAWMRGAGDLVGRTINNGLNVLGGAADRAGEVGNTVKDALLNYEASSYGSKDETFADRAAKRGAAAVGVVQAAGEPFSQIGKATDRSIVETDPTFRSLYEKNLQKKTYGARQQTSVQDEVARETLDQAAAALLRVRDDPNSTDEEKNSADTIAGLISAKRFAELGGPWIAKGGAELLAKGVGNVKGAIEVAGSGKGALAREAQYSGHTPVVRGVPEQGVGAGLRDRLGKTPDAYADVGPKQQAAVDDLTAVRLARQTEKTGGFSYNTVTKDEPKTGFAVSSYPEFETKVPLDANLPEAIKSFQAAHADILSQPGHHMGAWVDQGIVYLDVSILEKTPEAAAATARKFNQQAYYDLGKGESVSVAGVGDAGADTGVRDALTGEALDQPLTNPAGFGGSTSPTARYRTGHPKATPKQVEDTVTPVAEQEADKAQRAAAQTLAVDEPSVGKRTWTPEEKALLGTLDTGKFKASNIIKHVLARTPDQQGVGRAWYEQLRRDFSAKAAELGVDYDSFVGIIAALSPRTMWPRGKFSITEGNNVSRQFTNFPAKNNVKGAEMLVREWQNNSILQSGTLEEIRAELKRVGAGQWTTFPNGVGKPGTGNAEKAIRMLNGEEPKKLLPQKTGSFLDNFLGNEDNVTGDVWAIRAALDDPKAADALTPKQYEQLQNAYRQAAAELGYTPEAVQAIAWDSVKENPRFTTANRFITSEQKKSALAWDTVAAELRVAREGPATKLGAFGIPDISTSARHLEGRPGSRQDAVKRVVQLGDVATTDQAKAYGVAKAKPGFQRTAADKVAMQNERTGQGGGEPDLGFQNETFSPQSQPTIAAMKDAMRPGLEPRVAPITHEDTLLAAQLTGHTPEWAAKALPKRGVLSTDITKVSLGIEEKLSIVDDITNKLTTHGAGSLSSQERLDALFAMRGAAALMKDFSEGVSETARALNARKIEMSRSLAIDPSEGAFREALRKIAGTKASPDKIDELLLQLAAVRGDRSKTLGILRQLNHGNGWDMAFEYSQAAILSAMPTHAVNVYSGMIQHALMLGRVAVEMPIQAALQFRAKGPKAGPEDLAGFVVGYLDGLKGVSGRTADLMRRRVDFYDYSQGQYAAKHGAEMIQFGGAIPGRIGEVVRTPFKALTIEDLFQTMPAYSGRLRELATQQARGEGLKGLDALRRAAEIVRDAPDDMMMKAANEFSERYALHARGPKLRATQHTIENIPGLRYLVRFTTTPTNLVQMGLDYSPLGFSRIKDAKSKADIAAITAEAAIGTSIIGSFMGMLESGEMTGLTPANKTERDLMQAEGVGPMMIQSSKVPLVGWVQQLFNANGDANKRWVSGAVLGPLVVPYLIAAAIRTVESQKDNPDPKAMQAAVGAMVRTLADQVPMLQGIRDVQNVISNPITVQNGEVNGAIPDLAAQVARTFVPSFFGMFERMVDQYKRDPSGIAQTIQSIIPILASQGMDVGPLHVTPVQGKSDVLGRAVPNVNTGALALFPRGGRMNDPHPVLVENRRLATFGFPGFTGVTATGTTIGSGSNGVSLTPDAAARYQEIAGHLTEQYLNELINSPIYANKSDEQKAKDFQTKIEYARIEARKRLAQEFMGTITDDFGIPKIVARVATDKAKGIAIGMRATTKLYERADFISSFLSQIDGDPALKDAVASEMSNRPRGPLQKGTVERVIDGDTIVVGGKHIRLFGVDVPEKNTPAGQKALAALHDFVVGKDITYQLSDQSTFERTVGDVFANGQSLSDWMVNNHYGTVHLPAETDPNRYSLDVYRRVIPLRQQIKSDPILSAEYTKNGQVVGNPQVWAEADAQKTGWDAARKAGDTTVQADRKFPVYAAYRLLNSQTGGKNPVRKKFIDEQEKKGIPLSKFVGDFDKPSNP